MAPEKNKKNEPFFDYPELDHKVISSNTLRKGHEDTRMDIPRTGVATREKIVKNRIPWWSELISKGKIEHELKN